MGFFNKMYYCSCLLFFSFFMVFSNVDSASVHKRGLQLPTNINLDLKLGKGSAAKNAEAPPPTDGSHKTVINAPFGLASLTITTSNNNKKPSSSSSSSSAIKEPEVKPDPKITTVAPPKEKIPEVTSAASSTTQNVDLLIDEIFSGSNSNSAGSTTTTRSNIDANNAEQTGEGVLDIRMPTPAPSKPKRSRS
ncbi:uncharacterized protein LOC135847112 isoform X3 [Planococcus citri]|uniref:uncharacterized protein LOC135847112 isoform X3 n=1 Tax=Planococcus citri TaxID=170843 RepID=UPI0031F89F12